MIYIDKATGRVGCTRYLMGGDRTSVEWGQYIDKEGVIIGTGHFTQRVLKIYQKKNGMGMLLRIRRRQAERERK